MINEQYEELLKLMSETPNIMSIFDENVALKSKIEQYENEQNPQTVMSTQ